MLFEEQLELLSNDVTEMGDGHCGLPRAELIGLAGKLLEVPPPLIESALEEELAEETVTADLVGDTECIFLTGLYLAERGISEHVKRIRAGALPWAEIDADKALPWIEQKTGLTLAASQAEAIRLALRSKLMVITGGARSLNVELQAALNPAGDKKVERFGWTFAPGDKVMQIENDYDKDVYNGDI